MEDNDSLPSGEEDKSEEEEEKEVKVVQKKDKKKKKSPKPEAEPMEEEEEAKEEKGRCLPVRLFIDNGIRIRNALKYDTNNEILFLDRLQMCDTVGTDQPIVCTVYIVELQCWTGSSVSDLHPH
jgi:hypothetical protein